MTGQPSRRRAITSFRTFGGDSLRRKGRESGDCIVSRNRLLSHGRQLPFSLRVASYVSLRKDDLQRLDGQSAMCKHYIFSVKFNIFITKLLITLSCLLTFKSVLTTLIHKSIYVCICAINKSKMYGPLRCILLRKKWDTSYLSWMCSFIKQSLKRRWLIL